MGLLSCLVARADHAALVPRWPDGYVPRVELLALLETLNAELLSHDSATATLEKWCAAHRLASPARLLAERVTAAPRAPTPRQRLELKVTAAEPVRYRRVRLRCGDKVLSEADNWYVPGRLTPAMNESLDTTDTPFGKVVGSLNFERHTLSSTRLWSPLAEGWEMQPHAAGGAAELKIPHAVLEHRALLALPDGTPFSEVVETYTSDVLDFELPQP